MKNFGIERFKTNCHKATDGFNLVMAHLATRQLYLKDMQMKKFQQIRSRGEAAIANARHAQLNLKFSGLFFLTAQGFFLARFCGDQS